MRSGKKPPDSHFHRDAGSTDVIEIHGNVHELFCTSCGEEEWVADFSQLNGVPPSCAACGSLVRPRVVLFDELLPQNAIARLEEAMAGPPDIVISIGTTAGFPYIAAPVMHAAREGVPTIEINPGDSEISGYVQHRFKARGIDVLPHMAKELGVGA